MRIHIHTRLVVALPALLLTLGTGLARAQQPASAFEQIRFKVEEGDAVDLTEASGQVVRGELRKPTDREVWLDVRDDALTRRFRLVYSAPGRPSRAQVMVAPIASNGARRAAVALWFR